MRKNKIIVTLLAIVFLFSCVKNTNAQEIIIGTQTWSTKNLDVSTFRNGDIIPEAETDSAWITAGEEQKPAWCYYANDSANGAKYGKLYNWYAVNDKRGLAPKGWHVPSDVEWTILADYLGGEEVAGIKMKSTSNNGTNASGFTGLPGGNCFSLWDPVTGTLRDGRVFGGIGSLGCWWSSTEDGNSFVWFRTTNYSGDGVFRGSNNYKQDGFSVRCIKD